MLKIKNEHIFLTVAEKVLKTTVDNQAYNYSNWTSLEITSTKIKLFFTMISVLKSQQMYSHVTIYF